MAAHAFDLMTLLDAPGGGPGRVRKLLKRWSGAEADPLMDDRLLSETLTPAQVASLPESRERVKRHWNELERNNVVALSIVDPAYPDVLRRTLARVSYKQTLDRCKTLETKGLLCVHAYIRNLIPLCCFFPKKKR